MSDLTRRTFLRKLGVGGLALGTTSCARLGREEPSAKPRDDLVIPGDDMGYPDLSSQMDSGENTKPNFLIIVADDCTYNDLPLYGGENVDTPNIDRLANEGVVFDKAFVSMSMCVPCRTELYTGLYPVRSGSCWNHSQARPGTKSIVHYLRDLGYRVGLTGKNHVSGPGGVFTPEIVKGVEGKCISKTAEFDHAGMTEFMSRNDSQPFCLIVGLVVPHYPWTVGNPENFDQAELRLPPNVADTPVSRKEFADYLAEVEVLDEHVGRTLQALKKTGHEQDTVVLFTSEQGSRWPGNKWTCYNTGVHTGLVVRWPELVEAGSRTDAMVQYSDVLPTLVELAGGTPERHSFDGSSFADVLKGKSHKHREYAYMMHNNIPEGPPFPIRAVTDGKYHYIRNLQPDQLYIEKHVMGDQSGPNYWNSWMAQTGPWIRTSTNTTAVSLINRFMKRPAEELYVIDEDVYEMHNRISDSTLKETAERLSSALDSWMEEQGDPGVSIDTEESWRAGRKGEHTF